MRKSPLMQMKEAFGEKEKLVEVIASLLSPSEEETAEQFKARLLRSSNAKLLHLHAVAKEIKDRFGSKEKLVAALLSLLGRAKDVDYAKRLLRHTPSRLLDMVRAAEKRAGRKAA